MTDNTNENGGFYRYPEEITLGTRLTKADVEHRRMLYQKSLDEKWYKIQKGERYGDCAFCEDANDECDDCKISPGICAHQGWKGLYAIWDCEMHQKTKAKLADQMVSEMEARIKDCDVILNAMQLGGYDEINDSERII